MNFSVKQFYADKTILITGCTGFLAKMILEKIIRSCSNFK
jgi:FlaA1/EpsC-like NDP-sugar epimerase